MTRIRARLQHVFLELRHRRRSFRTLNWIELSRANALQNVRLIKKQHPTQSVIPVLKANAYGHGLKEMAEILNDADCELLAVDGYFEAGKIRFISKHRLLVLGYILPENVPLLDTKHCSFVAQDVATLKAFAALNKPVRIHIELNTGMNRLGLADDELSPFLEVLRESPTLELEGVMSHLAEADNDCDESFTALQVKRFDAYVRTIRFAGFRPKFVHIAQTAGSTKVHSRYANTIRLGIGLYGLNPLSERDPRHATLEGLKPVLSLKSTVVKVHELEKGDKVSYGGTFTAKKQMRVGVLPLGYYEGVPRKLSNRGVITSIQQILPIVGRVCMHHTMIDLKDTRLAVGDKVTIFSSDSAMPNAILRMCKDYSMFPYLLVTKLSSSIRRRII